MTAAVIFALIGLGFLVTGLCLQIGALRFRRRAIRVPGTIVSMHAVATQQLTQSTGSGPIYRPVVEFATVEGQLVRAESRIGSNPPAGRVGETVGVFYDPAQPSRIQLDTRVGSGTCLAFVLGVFGALLLVVGALAYALARFAQP